MSSVNPVFIKQRDIPNSESSFPTVLELCLSAERSCGKGSIVGAQSIRGLWRLYPASQEARMQLLVKGIRVRDVCVRLCDTNPFILRDDSGQEKPSTKLWIDEIPISVADSEIEHSLSKLGCELRSEIKLERARDPDNKLTRFLTGRRFVFITVPKNPLDRTTKVSLFTAKLFHKEQKKNNNPPFCSICLQSGHHRSACTSEVVCRTCRLPGHKRGDPSCTMSPPDPQHSPSDSQRQGKDEQSTAPSQGTKEKEKEKEKEKTKEKENEKEKTKEKENEKEKTKEKTGKQDKDSPKIPPGTNRKDSSKPSPGGNTKDSPVPPPGTGTNTGTNRGRPLSRQTTLAHVFEAGTSRSRSAPPKRPRSGDQDSPSAATAGKQARHAEDGENDLVEDVQTDKQVTSIWD
eukprot:TRINITY_DN24476_c0_g2_i3.p1 TRINITY_DN24476_c0_g2~~TRINITY_DN24476_c0_g2_i3.p1  ORF type:complete len:403 (-),score=71.25 TRINITY_DN24476_c0_g2_i3:645-1853(-)